MEASLIATFCRGKVGKVLFNDIVKIWNIGFIDGYEDRLVSIFLRLVVKSVRARNFGSFIDMGLEICVPTCIKILTIFWFFIEISQWWNRRRILNAKLKGIDLLTRFEWQEACWRY